MSQNPMADPEVKENFERAFSSGSGYCRHTCDCGRTFYDWENSYDWEEGELEKLQADAKAIGVPYSVGTVMFQGKEYVMDCDCWIEHAARVVSFINSHGREIAEFLTREKARKQREADQSPIVK